LFAALLFAGVLGCEPIVEPVVRTESARCPRACPAECPQECLPSGYCSDYTRTAGQLGFGPLAQGGSWKASLGGFPPAAVVTVSIHAGFDATARQGQAPFGFGLNVVANGQWAFAYNDNYSSFPLFSDWAAPASAGSDGAVPLELDLSTCRTGTGVPTECTIAPDSTVRARLLNGGSYLEAPLCE
jgi:hypothetical protein